MSALARAARVTALLSVLGRSAWASEWNPDGTQYFQRANELLQTESPDYEGAYQNFKLAYDQSRDWRVLSGLGRCAEALERDGEAIQAYEEYLARGAGTISPEEEGAVERALQSLRANLARIIVTSPIADLTLVDSRVGSSAPPQLHRLENGRIELEVRAGTHLVTAMSAGDRLEWQVALAPGIAAQRHFEFKRTPRRAPTDARAPASRTESSTLRTVSFVAAGVGSAALVGGAVTGLLVLAYEDDARALCRNGPRGGTECPESARKDFDSTRSLATTTNVLLIGGGVLAATGIAALLLSSGELRAGTRGFRVSPSVGVGSTALSVSGTF